jgi:hypothetical protein
MENFENENVMYEENNVEVVPESNIEVNYDNEEEDSEEESSENFWGKVALISVGGIGFAAGAATQYFASKRAKKKDEPKKEKKPLIGNPVKNFQEKRRQKKIENAYKVLDKYEKEPLLIETEEVEVEVEEKE